MAFAQQPGHNGHSIKAASSTSTTKTQTTCPVLAGEINKSVFTDYKGKRIYFCCPGCIDEFKKDPEKYIKKMEAEGVVLEETSTAKIVTNSVTSEGNKPGETQTQCPMMGGKINKTIFSDYKGKRIYFAGPMCKSTFEKDPEQYFKKLNEQKVILEDSPRSK
ncbi:MAG: YHS domain-containing protein [Oligoflexia bacterium]|nr:YHS domain-containing protein [Oligoflexia bacterium]